MVEDKIYYNGKIFYYDSINNYQNFKRRLTLLRKVHPNLKYKYKIIGSGNKTKFILYVRKWGYL